ncbi:unnamed protein product [Cylicocyclus nassatus]|uniref:Peptidase A1 domain-containing protein n=1 Tax=Cylicocyclus nassatus TaxID=53992 RepID=A0AA36M7C9_CYLNA|nr:unnamed protein product [Cylicocyclus nassatus]
MGISIILAFFILRTTWKVVYTLTWKDPMHEHDGFGNAMSISVPLESAQDGYIHRVLIGNNGQEFKVMVTTSSTLLWVPKVGCKGSGSRRTYNPSPSFEEDGRNWTQKSYGGTTNGELGIDDVKIGGLLKPTCNFGMATNISTDTKLPVDGVLGLAPFADSSIPGQPFMAQIKDLLTSHMFTIYLSQQSGSNAGSVTYGSVNNDNCVKMSTKQAFVRAYYFKMSSVSLGNFTHSYRDNAVPELIPFIIGPQEVIDGLAKAAGATLIDGSYEIRCNATIPKLEIKAGRYGYSIRSNRLIVKKESRCVLALASQTGGGFGLQWYFGAPLLQEYCITFDLKTRYLEFRGTKSSPTTGSSTRRLPTTTPKNITSSSTKTTRRVLSTTPKRNTTISSTRTTRKIPTTTTKKTTTSTRKTTRRITTTTPKRNITTSSTRTTRRIPTTTPRKISTSSTKTTRRIVSTTSKTNATTSRPTTTRRVLSTTPRRNLTTTRRFTSTPLQTTTKLAPTAYLYRLVSFMVFSVFCMW